MTDITIHVNSGASEPVRKRKTFAFGLVTVKTNGQACPNPGNAQEDLRVLGLVVVEDEVQSTPKTGLNPKA